MNKFFRLVLMFGLLISLVFSTPLFVNAEDSSKLANRIAGLDRYQTAVEVAKTGWPTGSDSLILATGENFPDALSATTLAKKLSSPILLTPGDSISNDTLNEIIKLSVKQVYIVGGPGAISNNVVNSLKNLGINVERIAGIDRFETSVCIADKLGAASMAFIATGEDFPDALSIAPIAAKKGMPILLVSKDAIAESVKNYLAKQNITKTYVIGGNDVISSNVVSQLPNPQIIEGSDKFERNVNIINMFSSELDFSNVYLATGMNFPDALAGSALAAMKSAPIVLLNTVPAPSTVTLINEKSSLVKVNYVLGGKGAVSTETINSLGLRETVGDSYIMSDIIKCSSKSEMTTCIANPDQFMSVGGTLFYKGYCLSAPLMDVFADFNLEGKYNKTSGKLGIDDLCVGKNATIQFLGDGKLLGTYELKQAGVTREFSINVDGIQKLTVKIHQDIGSSIDLLDVIIE